MSGSNFPADPPEPSNLDLLLQIAKIEGMLEVLAWPGGVQQ